MMKRRNPVTKIIFALSFFSAFQLILQSFIHKDLGAIGELAYNEN